MTGSSTTVGGATSLVPLAGGDPSGSSGSECFGWQDSPQAVRIMRPTTVRTKGFPPACIMIACSMLELSSASLSGRNVGITIIDQLPVLSLFLGA